MDRMPRVSWLIVVFAIAALGLAEFDAFAIEPWPRNASPPNVLRLNPRLDSF